MHHTCDLSIISDCHLGTRNCRDEELHDYLCSVRPKRLIINGDLCDLGAYFTRYWPESHQLILERLMELAHTGTEVVYVIGNHDAPLMRFADLTPGIALTDEYRCTYFGRRMLITHGHRFDHLLCRWPLLRRLGGAGYDALQTCETALNRATGLMGFPSWRFVNAIKHRVPGARAAIVAFEQAAVELALAEDVDVICCGHIHVPRAIEHERDGRAVAYLNSGDWVEHCTALEAQDGAFCLHHHSLHPASAGVDDWDEDAADGIQTTTTATPAGAGA
ncbi:MAG: UDP-2,3-diacylglucosamine diphosphatase [Planctomycetota bacterium]